MNIASLMKGCHGLHSGTSCLWGLYLPIKNILDVLLWQCVGMTGLFVVMSYVQRDFSTALSGKDTPGFYKAIWKFVGIISIAAPLYAFYQYMQVLCTTCFLSRELYVTRKFALSALVVTAEFVRSQV